MSLNVMDIFQPLATACLADGLMEHFRTNLTHMLASFKIHRYLQCPAQGRVDPFAGDVPAGQRVGVQEQGQGDVVALLHKIINSHLGKYRRLRGFAGKTVS